MKLSCLIIFLFCTVTSYAQDSVKTSKMAFSGCSGGMMLHTGYVQSRDITFYNTDGSVHETLQMKGAPFGIGGAIRAHFGKHLRVGSEGYVSTLVYGKYKSYSSIGWGGLLVDCAWPLQRWTPFIGGTIGGGSVKNVTLLDETPQDFVIEQQSTSYRKYAFMALNPFVGVEYALTAKIHFVFKMDYLLNLTDWQDDYVNGVRFFVGVMFCH
ncbi:MAG: hypothetical protein PHH23_03135 [Paludibacteraceae bacterium]|nr:hypothetical protein [Paludibacteraceae bacterium]